MSVLTRWLVPAQVAVGIVLSVSQALAERPSCSTLAAAAANRDPAEVAREHGVTRARVESCARVVARRDEQAARRADQQSLRIRRAALLQR